MSCEAVQSKLSEYAVGLLNECERADVQRHLDECDACLREWEALQRVGLMIDAVSLEEAPPRLWESIRSRIEAEPVRQSLWDVLRWRQFPRLAYAGVLATIVVAIALFLLFQPSKPRDDESGNFIERHGMLAWNDPLSDKAALGAMVGYSVAAKEAR
jgi:anti-sigma factor RsiW